MLIVSNGIRIGPQIENSKGHPRDEAARRGVTPSTSRASAFRSLQVRFFLLSKTEYIYVYIYIYMDARPPQTYLHQQYTQWPPRVARLFHKYFEGTIKTIPFVKIFVFVDSPHSIFAKTFQNAMKVAKKPNKYQKYLR